MAYRAPNAYARFVKNAGTVSTLGSTRIMGIIGTGLNYYEVYNESIQKSIDKPFDEIKYGNIFEVINVSSKPFIFGKKTLDSVVYEEGEDKSFTLVNGKYIAWNTLASDAASANKLPATGDGAVAFLSKVSCKVNDNMPYFVQDGKWKIEITYVNSEGTGTGLYRVINDNTNEIVGEYETSEVARYDVIPGVELTVTDTMVTDSEGNILTAIGDYIKIETIAGKTEKEASVKVDTTANQEFTDPTALSYSSALKDKISNLKIVNPKMVENASYELVVIDAASSTIKITKVGGTTPLFDNVITSVSEFLEVIPGITFVLNALPENAVDGDAIKIITTARVVGSENAPVPAEGTTYYVSYKYRKDPSGYEPKLFFDYDDIVAEYGNYDVTATGNVVNSLALGAEIAFLNGIQPIVCIQAKNDSDYEIKAAIDKLQRGVAGVNNINTIIPFSESASVGAHAKNHVNLMSSPDNGKERMVYLGASRNQVISKLASALDKTEGMMETAKSLLDERVVYVVPGELIKEVRDLRTGKVYDRKVPACYAAVAVAALGLRNDPAEPLTNKYIAGFKGITMNLLESEKNLLAEAGCCVLEQEGANIKIRHGITTSTTDIESNEITLVQIKDFVLDSTRKATAQLYIGNKNRPSIVSDVQYTITSILNQLMAQDIILGYTNLTVKRNKDNPTQIDVKFEVEAVYPLNFISISFGFKTNS